MKITSNQLKNLIREELLTEVARSFPIYKAYYYATATEYYFSSKPSKADLAKVAGRDSIDPDNIGNWEITRIRVNKI